MRVIKEFTKKDIKVSIFYMNQKFIVKFEKENLEQIYKFSQMDYFIQDENKLMELLNDELMDTISETFEKMKSNTMVHFDDIRL